MIRPAGQSAGPSFTFTAPTISYSTPPVSADYGYAPAPSTVAPIAPVAPVGTYSSAPSAVYVPPVQQSFSGYAPQATVQPSYAPGVYPPVSPLPFLTQTAAPSSRVSPWLVGLLFVGVGAIVYATKGETRANPSAYGPKFARVHLERERLDRGGYTKRGRYFGIGKPLFRFSGEDLVDQYGHHREVVDDWVRANDRADAMRILKGRYRNIRFAGRE